MANVLDCNTVVSEFELQSHYDVYFRINAPWERYETPYITSYVFNSIIAVLLQAWIWHLITYEGWYVMKRKN